MTGRCILYDGVMSDRVNRHRLTPIVLAVLAVVALSVSAATLDVVREKPGPESSDGTGVGGDGTTFDSGETALADSSSSGSVVVTLLRLFFGVVVCLGFISLVVRLYQSGWRSMIPVIVAAVGCVLVMVALYYLLTLDPSQESQNGLFGNESLSLPSGSPLSSGDGALAVSDALFALDAPVVLFVVLVLAVIVGLLVLSRTTGNSLPAHRTDGSTTNDTDQTDIDAVGAAAGRAADSLDADETLSNAIYRAWGDMTTHLDLSRETSTPREFAQAAVAAGMSREDVEKLTHLFETTRYGEQAASEEREQRARTALRRIEREYAPEESKEEDAR